LPFLVHYCIAVDQQASDAASLIASWIEMNHIKTLNVTGPRASGDPDIYMDAVNILTHLLQ
jgi:hypothetical protein